MLPFRHIGDSRAEQWLGLVDAVYAIAMTVLALLLPEIIGESFQLFEKTSELKFLLIGIYQVAFYFFGFLILYEVWCFHRCILATSNTKNRTQNIYTGSLLAVVCLAPAWAGTVFKNIDAIHFWIETRNFQVIGLLGWLLLFLMYFLLNLLARSARDVHRAPALKTIAKQARIRSLFFALIAIFHGIRLFIKDWPVIPSVLIFGLYVLLSFNQDKLLGILRQPPQLRRRRP